MIRDAEGRGMSPSHATKGSRRYRYYFTAAGVDRKMPADGWRVPAADIERAVTGELQRWLGASSEVLEALGPTSAPAILVAAASQQSTSLKAMPAAGVRACLLDVGATITIQADAIAIELDRTKLLSKLGLADEAPNDHTIMLTVPACLVRRGCELRLALAPPGASTPALIDTTLVNLLARADKAYARLTADDAGLGRLQRNELARAARLRTLAPDIVAAICEGRQPASLSARKLLRTPSLPIDWKGQRTQLGFA